MPKPPPNPPAGRNGGGPLQITHIISSLAIGGAQQLLLELSLEMTARGHDVRVIGLRSGTMAKEFRGQGIPVDELALRGMVSVPTFLQLVSRLQRQRPEIVHTHLGRADNYGRVAAKIARVPVIVSTVHNVEAWKSRFFLRWIDAWTSTFADRLIACSGRVAEHLRELHVSMEKVVVVKNGIHLRHWTEKPDPAAAGAIRRELGAGQNEFVVGVIGRLETQKGHSYLFQAIAALKDEIPDLRLWVIGEGSLRESLERLAGELGLSSKITLTGVRRDMRSVYAALDLVVMPSLWEGLPITLLEAMACQRPILATTVGGIPEVITDEKNGLLIPPKNVPALIVALKRCHRERQFTQSLANAAFETVTNEFSIDHNAQKLLALYEELVCLPSRKQPR